MPNACFRCRASISSGGTFCETCRSEVSLGEATPGARSRWWLVVAATTVGVALGIGLGAVGPILSVPVAGPVGSLLVLVSWVGFLGGLTADVRGLQRARGDWTPSTWYLVALAFPAVFVVPIPFVGVYYLYRRRQRVGLGR